MHLPKTVKNFEPFGKFLKGEYVKKNYGMASTLGVPKTFFKTKRPQRYIDSKS